MMRWKAPCMRVKMHSVGVIGFNGGGFQEIYVRLLLMCLTLNFRCEDQLDYWRVSPIKIANLRFFFSNLKSRAIFLNLQQE